MLNKLCAAAVPSQGQQDIDRDPYRNSGDINRLRSVHLDRKLSSTARVPKRSTIVESPTGKVAHSSDASHAHRTPHEVTPGTRQPAPQSAQQGSIRAQVVQKAPPVHVQPPQPQHQRSLPSPGTIDTNVQSQVIRPPFARGNTAVKIVDETGPSSPAGLASDDPMVGGIEDGITLADIPQLVEAAQAREQRRSLPSQSSIPYIAELNPLQLAIIKHCAVLALQRSPLRDQFDLDEILELVEAKKSSFYGADGRLDPGVEALLERPTEPVVKTADDVRRQTLEALADEARRMLDEGVVAAPEDPRPGDVPLYLSDTARLRALADWRPRRDARTILADVNSWIAAHEADLRAAL